MSKHALTLILLVTSLLLTGCATSDDGAVAGRAILKAAAVTVAVVGEAVAMGNCDKINSGTAREACLSKIRDPQAARNVSLNPAPNAKFEDFETYKAKREAELAKNE